MPIPFDLHTFIIAAAIVAAAYVIFGIGAPPYVIYLSRRCGS